MQSFRDRVLVQRSRESPRQASTTCCTATTASAGARARGMQAVNCGQARGISMALQETHLRFLCAAMQPRACRRVGERVLPAAQHVGHGWSLGKVRSGQHARRYGLPVCAACVAFMQESIASVIPLCLIRWRMLVELLACQPCTCYLCRACVATVVCEVCNAAARRRRVLWNGLRQSAPVKSLCKVCDGRETTCESRLAVNPYCCHHLLFLSLVQLTSWSELVQHSAKCSIAVSSPASSDRRPQLCTL